MYRYSLYIARSLAHSALLVIFSLTSIVWLTQALRFIDFIVNQGISIRIFLTLTLLLVPSLLLLIVPIALFSATLFLYNKLQHDSELVALEAAGLNRWKLAKPAVMVAVAATIFGYCISLYLMPLTYGRFRDMQAFLRNNYVSLMLQEGVFSSPVEGLTVFVRERDSNGILKGILVHDNRQKGVALTMMAESATLVETPQGPRFLLENGNRQELRKGKLSLLNFKSYVLDVSLYAGQATARPSDPQEKYLWELFEDAEHSEPGVAQKLRAEAHQRLIWPLYSMGMPILGLAILLSGQFNRRGHTKRVIAAVAVASAMVIAALALRAALANHPALVVIAYASAILPIVLAVVMLTGRSLHEWRSPPMKGA